MSLDKCSGINPLGGAIHRLLIGAGSLFLFVGMAAMAAATGDEQPKMARPVRAAEVTKDGKQLVTADEDGIIRAWDLDSRRVTRAFRTIASSCYAISADGQQALVGFRENYPGSPSEVPGFDSLVLWDVRTGRKLRAFKNKGESYSAVALSPDGKFALSSEGGLVQETGNSEGIPKS